MMFNNVSAVLIELSVVVCSRWAPGFVILLALDRPWQ